jgi:hypothetical protein
MLVVARFACAFADAMLFTTENEAINSLLLELPAAGILAGHLGHPSWGTRVLGGNRKPQPLL